MSEVVSGLAQELVGSGIVDGIFTAPVSGTVLCVNYRRDFGEDTTHVLLRQTGGQSFPRKAKENQGFQVLVDANKISLAQAKAREVYEFWEEVTACTISGGTQLLWLRAIAPPQAIPIGPGSGKERFQFSVNFDALIVKE